MNASSILGKWTSNNRREMIIEYFYVESKYKQCPKCRAAEKSADEIAHRLPGNPKNREITLESFETQFDGPFGEYERSIIEHSGTDREKKINILKNLRQHHLNAIEDGQLIDVNDWKQLQLTNFLVQSMKAENPEIFLDILDITEIEADHVRIARYGCEWGFHLEQNYDNMMNYYAACDIGANHYPSVVITVSGARSELIFPAVDGYNPQFIGYFSEKIVKFYKTGKKPALNPKYFAHEEYYSEYDDAQERLKAKLSRAQSRKKESDDQSSKRDE